MEDSNHPRFKVRTVSGTLLPYDAGGAEEGGATGRGGGASVARGGSAEGLSEEMERREDQDWVRHFLRRGYTTAVVHGSPVLYKYPSGLLSFATRNHRNSPFLSEAFGYEAWKLSGLACTTSEHGSYRRC